MEIWSIITNYPTPIKTAVSPTDFYTYRGDTEQILGKKHYILSSPGRTALHIVQDTTGNHEVYLLDKETIDGQQRFTEAFQKHHHYVIDRPAGLVYYYSYNGLDSQRPIDE